MPSLLPLPLLLLAAAPAAPAPAPLNAGSLGAASLEARVQAVAGEVVVQDGARWRPVAPGEALAAGAEVRTGPKASAALALGAGDVLVVGEGASLRLEAGVAPRVRLARGEVEVALASGGAGLLLAEAGARGAEVRLGGTEARVRVARAAEGLAVAALAGQVQLGQGAEALPLPAGQVRQVAGGAVSDAQPLPAAPQPLSPTPDARFLCPGLVVRLAWGAQPQAAAYRVQVARDAGFRALVHSALATRTHALFAAPAPSPYFWRVASVGADGTAGDFSPARPLHCEAEAPRERLLQPVADAHVRAEPKQPLAVDFRWEAVAGASGYRLVLAPTPALDAPEARVVPTPGTEARVEGLAQGTWYWGVWAEGEPPQPLFLSPRRLDVGPPRSLVKVPTVIGDWGP